MNDRKSRILTKNMEENKRKDFQNLYFIFQKCNRKYSFRAENWKLLKYKKEQFLKYVAKMIGLF